MKRPTVVAMHVLTLPAAAVVSLVIGLVTPRVVPPGAIEVALHDTYFVVAHFHASILLGASLALTTLVAARCNSLTWLLGAAWALLILHLVASVVAWRASISFEPTAPSIVSVAPPAHPGFAYLYLGSALGGFLVTLLALVASLVKALRSPVERAA